MFKASLMIVTDGSNIAVLVDTIFTISWLAYFWRTCNTTLLHIAEFDRIHKIAGVLIGLGIIAVQFRCLQQRCQNPIFTFDFVIMVCRLLELVWLDQEIGRNSSAIRKIRLELVESYDIGSKINYLAASVSIIANIIVY